MRNMKASFMVLLTVLVAGCAVFGVPSPKTFNERLAAAYVTNTSARATATTLLTANVISVSDAEHALEQTDNVREGLDVARDIHASLPEAGESKLDAVLTGLYALDSYLCVRNHGVYDHSAHVCRSKP